MKYFLFGAFSVILLGMLTAGAYLYGLEKGEKKYAPTPTPTLTQPTPQPTELPTHTPTPTIVSSPTLFFPPINSSTPSAR